MIRKLVKILNVFYAKQNFVSLIIIIVLFAFFSNVSSGQQEKASFVWNDDSGAGSKRPAFFRKSFGCKLPVTKASKSIFSDSRFQLFVNGNLLIWTESGIILSLPNMTC